MEDKAAEAAAQAASDSGAADAFTAFVTGKEVVPDDAGSPEQPDAESAAEEVQHEADSEVYDLEPELPEDVAALIDEPDFEQEAAEELASEVEEEEETYDYEIDEEKAQLKKKLRAMEKKLEFTEKQKLEASRKAWQDEANKYFPLSSPEQIQATSRRAFLRQAKEQHETLKPKVEKLTASREQILAEAKAEAEQIKATAKAEAEAAWGRPSVSVTPVAGLDRSDEKYQAITQRRGLAASLKQRWIDEQQGGEE